MHTVPRYKLLFLLRVLRAFSVSSVVRLYHGGHGGFSENAERKAAIYGVPQYRYLPWDGIHCSNQ